MVGSCRGPNVTGISWPARANVKRPGRELQGAVQRRDEAAAAEIGKKVAAACIKTCAGFGSG
jgi:hypothetical protein